MAREPQPEAAPFDVRVIASGQPPGLNTADPATSLGPDESPDCFGLDLSVDGAIAKGSIPSGESRITADKTVGFYHYNRLWKPSGTSLNFGAPLYDAVLYDQGLGSIPFLEDATSLQDVFVAFGTTQGYVGKTTGGYILSNLTDSRGADFWNKSDIIQALKCTAAANVTELDGLLFVSNATGLQVFSGGRVVDATRKVRNGLTNFASQALTVDYQKKYIIGGTKFVYEIPTGKIFNYATSGFRYTTRRWHTPRWEPIAIDRVLFEFERSNTAEAWFEYDVRYDDGTWETAPERVVIDFDEEQFVSYAEGLETVRSSITFQLRITNMSSNLRIKEIRVDEEVEGLDSYKV